MARNLNELAELEQVLAKGVDFFSQVRDDPFVDSSGCNLFKRQVMDSAILKKTYWMIFLTTKQPPSVGLRN